VELVSAGLGLRPGFLRGVRLTSTTILKIGMPEPLIEPEIRMSEIMKNLEAAMAQFAAASET